MFALLVAALLAGVIAVHPATAVEEPAGENAPVRYISGGVSESGMQRIDAETNGYNLKLLCVAQGAYLADVSVKITDSKGANVLDVVTDGPVLLAKLPPGSYTVTAKGEKGSVLTQPVKVRDARLFSYVLRFPAKEL